MGEHNSKESRQNAAFRELMKMSKEDLEFAKAICKEYKCSPIEAENRIMLIKNVAVTHAAKLGKNFKILIDLIADGTIIPTNTVFDFDQPLSAYLIAFDNKEKSVGEGKGLRMDLNVNFFGNDYKICVMRKSDFEKAHGKIDSEKESEK